MKNTETIQHFIKQKRRQGERFVTKRNLGLVRFWRSLLFPQRCYFIATAMFLALFLFDLDSFLYQFVMFSFVLVGLAKEVWPRFMLAWHSLPGKAFVLFIYAVIANFALASAGGLVNEITGISANALPYSHNLALILMLPSWFFITTVIALLMITLLTPVYLFLLLLLKPMGLHKLWHAPNYRFVFTTALVRYLWTAALFFKAILIATQFGVFGQFSCIEDHSVVIGSECEPANDVALVGDPATAETSAPLQLPLQPGVEEKDPKQPSLSMEKIISELNDSEDVSDVELGELIVNATKRAQAFRQGQLLLLAAFIYRYEADTRSRCAHVENSRVIEINDYEILQITTTESELGYEYNVIQCDSAAIGKGKVEG